MNVYLLGIINNKLRDITDMTAEQIRKVGNGNFVMVHGAENYEKAVNMFKNGMTMNEVQKEFCGFCGGKLPCGCSNPYPQYVEE